MPEISIIVPVYKVEKLLDRCVRSILSQTYQDFELILVDDGSPDNCPQMCDEYAKEDTRIRVLHKENGGLSDARNAGINIAVGRYIGFVDSDDYIAPDMYETLYNNLIKHNADVSVCGMYDCYGSKIVAQNADEGFYLFTSKEAIEFLLGRNGTGLFAVNKLYKKEIFEEIKYPVGKIYEDAFVIVDILLKTKLVVIDSAPKYYYVHHESSITISKFSKKYYDILKAHQHNFQLIEQNYPEILDVANFRIWWAYKQILSTLALDEKKNRKNYKADKKKISKMIRKDFFAILKNKYNSASQKISYCIIMVSPDLFMSIYRNASKTGNLK